MKAEFGDWQLLREYVHEDSQEAFAVLVERHVNFVYSTCLREVRDAALAEDTTQVVFLILSRKAPLLRESGTLSGWLFKTSRFASRNALKQELRRQRREQNIMQEIVAETNSATCASPAEGRAQLEEQLHGAIAHLNEAQRDVILLRYFQGKSVRETGEALGITEKAAERRIAYALEKMRQYFARHGAVVSVAALAVFIGEDAVQSAPAECAATVAQMAQSVAAGGTVAGAVGVSLTGAATPSHIVSLSQGVLKAMLISQIKTGVVACVGISVMAVSTVKLAHLALASQQEQSVVATASLPFRRTAFETEKRPDRVVKARSGDRAESPLKKSAAPVHSMPKAAMVHKTAFTAQPRRVEQGKAENAPWEHTPLPAKAPSVLLAQTKASPAKVEPRQVTLAAAQPQPGEIAVEGRLVAINDGRLIIDVSAYTLPGGKTSPVKPPKPKAILLNEQTTMHVRGSANRVQTIHLTPDALLRVIGLDKGTGEALPARDIAVWDSVANRVYQWSGDFVKPEVPETPEVVDPADVPPDDTDRNERPNLFPQGDFQKAAVGKAPFGWTVSPGVRTRVVEKDGKRWLSIKTVQQGRGTIRIDIPVQSDWQRVRVAAQLKSKNFQRGEQWWHGARLDFNFFDAKGNVLKYGRGLNLNESGAWTKLSRTAEVPEGARVLRIDAGLFYSTGELLLDNIRIEANSPIEAPPLLPGFPEGKFEKIEGQGWPASFEPWSPDNVKVLEEDGNHFIRIISRPPGQSNAWDGRFYLPPEMKRVRVRARIRLTNYIPGQNSWNRAKIGLGAEDEMGKKVGDYLTSVEAMASDDWKTIEGVNSLPEGAKILHVQPQILGASGIFDVDDLEIIDATNDDLPNMPITPELPGGKFEDLDAKGWPLGWVKDAGKPEVFQVGEENGNHFLRLSSTERIYAAAKGRFKLPPEWRALKLRGRVRVKDLKTKPGAQGWETARVGFIYQNAQGTRAGGFQQSLELHGDTDWKELEVKGDIPRDAVYIEVAALLNDVSGVFDVDDLHLEIAKPDFVQAPIYEWTRAFPEGDFEHVDEQGNPLNWPADGKGRVMEEDGNHFLRLSNLNAQSSISMPSQWKLKPQWKTVRVRARMRGRNLKFSGNPLDGARMQILFLNAQDAIIQPVPAPLEMKKDSDWLDLQTKLTIPPGAVTIRLMPSLSRTSGILDVDDILIEPADE